MSELREALAGAAGQDRAVLEALRDSIDASAATLDVVIGLADDADPGVAAGATWLLRAWVEAGAKLDPDQIHALSTRLLRIGSPSARQHVCQTVRSLTIPGDSASAYASFLIVCCASERPLLRAWGVDGLYHLALAHPGYSEGARMALDAAAADPAASVRARARNLDAARLD